MRITFFIEYKTKPEESLYILGSHPLIGEWRCDSELEMKRRGDLWWLSLNFPTPFNGELSYLYIVKNVNGSSLREIEARSIIITGDRDIIRKDAWHGNDLQAPFTHAPFANLFLPHKSTIPTQCSYEKEIIISLFAPAIEESSTLHIIGNIPSLGLWNPQKAIPLTPKKGFRWEINIPLSEEFELFEYKFIKKGGDGSISWEEGGNRVIDLPQIEDRPISIVIESQYTSLSDYKPRYAGVALPVFSLRSHLSGGIGEFSDLKLLAEWAKLTGQKIIQILPINDTTTDGSWRDSYPYNCISVFALNPIYIRVDEIGDFPTQEIEEDFRTESQRLNKLQFLDFEKVYQLKKKYSYILFKEHWDRCKREHSYREFVSKNREWLNEYALYCAKRDGEYPTTFYKFIQYHLHLQLLGATQYLHSLGIALKGDIPIGVSPIGVDISCEPQYFHLDGRAGAPPDPFAEDGQNWGFPTYNWDVMEENNYLWWKRRLSHMENYFDAYRIDHILGFFRIWEIPSIYKSGTMGHFRPSLPLSHEEIHSKGFTLRPEHIGVLFLEDSPNSGQFHPAISPYNHLEYKSLSPKDKKLFDEIHDDYFYVRHNEFWKEIGYKRIPEIVSASNMLPCAEDLGMIPECVPKVLSDLKILTLEIPRMPKEMGIDEGNPANYPYLSVSTTGTHDMDTLRGWKKGLSKSDYREIILNELNSPSMFTILPLQDWLTLTDRWMVDNPSDERINTPSDSENLWRYRMIPYLEDLLSEETLTEEIKGLIKETRGLS